jgi:L-lactate dehydrogenase complex protein LldG
MDEPAGQAQVLAPAPGRQHGAREEILSAIRRALALPAPKPHLNQHANPRPASTSTSPLPAPAPRDAAPDASNATGSNAARLPAGEATRREGEGIRPAPTSADDALEAAGWVPDSSAPDADSNAKPGAKASGFQPIALPVLSSPAPAWRAWLPPVGESEAERVALLERNLLDLKAEFVRVPDAGALQVLAAEMARENGWARVASHAAPLLDAALAGLPGVEMLGTAGGLAASELESCEAGWTTCDALIAQTGTVLLSAREAGGRALSVLPPHHVVVATIAQVVPDLPAAFALARETYGDALPSSLSFITGPSRTGDIERILVLGAHGPKRLTVILVG